MSTAQQPEPQPRLHLFTVDDPRLWEFRSRLTDEQFSLSDVTDEEWNAFHEALAEA